MMPLFWLFTTDPDMILLSVVVNVVLAIAYLYIWSVLHGMVATLCASVGTK